MPDEILARAELLLRAKNYSGSGNWLDEANSHDAVNNGALFLPYAGHKYLYLPGIAANYARVPDHATLSVEGDIDIRADVTADDWTPAGFGALVTKRSAGSAGSTSYSFELNDDGTFNLTVSNGSTNYTNYFTNNSQCSCNLFFQKS